MFKFEDNVITYDNKPVLHYRDDNWWCDHISSSLPIDVAVAIFKYHYKHRVYLSNCTGEFLVKDLTRHIVGGRLLLGDTFVYKSGNIHEFENLPPQKIDVDGYMMHKLINIKSRVIPLLCDNISSLTCHYDPSNPCIRVFLKGTYVGYIPLL